MDGNGEIIKRYGMAGIALSATGKISSLTEEKITGAAGGGRIPARRSKT